MATEADLRQRVGEDLGLVGIGQDLEAQDVTRIDATYAEVYAFLKKKGLAVWVASSTIPDELIPSLALYMCFKLLGSYSVPEARYNRIVLDAGPKGENALVMIGEMSVPEYDDTTSDGGF